MPLYKRHSTGKKPIFASFQPTNALTQWTGLMFTKRASKPLLFTGNGRISIHSFFCPPFEAVFLDKNGGIVKLCRVEPSTPLVAANAFYLFEMPLGTIKKFKLKKGDKLQWKN